MGWTVSVSPAQQAAGGHMEYRIRIRGVDPDVPWATTVESIISRRFSQLFALHEWLKELSLAPPESRAIFPPKGTFLDNRSPRFLEERRHLLELYLRALVGSRMAMTNVSLRVRLEMTHHLVLYSTCTTCLACAIGARRGLCWCRAKVVCNNGRVLLITQCPEATHAAAPAASAAPTAPIVVASTTTTTTSSSDADSDTSSIASRGPRTTIFSTEYSSNARFFLRMITPALPALPRLFPALLQFPLGFHCTPRRLENACDLRKEKSLNFPPSVEIPIHDGRDFIPDEKIQLLCSRYKFLYGKRLQYGVVVSSRLAANMETLNRKVMLVRATMNMERTPLDGVSRAVPVIVEVTHDRLIDLVRLENSCFLQAHVYPSLRHAMRSGSETESVGAIQEALEELEREIDSISIMMFVVIERPLPNLRALMELVFAHPRTVRALVLSLTRAPRELVRVSTESIATAQDSASSGPTVIPTTHGTVDVSELCDHVARVSSEFCGPASPVDGTPSVTLDDFVSPVCLQIAEPLMRLLAWGQFNLRVSPLCGATTLFVQPRKRKSKTAPLIMPVPLTRIVDVEAAATELYTLLPKMANTGDLGILAATRLRSVLKKHQRARAPLDVSDLLGVAEASGSGGDDANSAVDVQAVFVHRQLDMGAMDAEHTVRPLILTEQVWQTWRSLDNAPQWREDK